MSQIDEGEEESSEEYNVIGPADDQVLSPEKILREIAADPRQSFDAAGKMSFDVGEEGITSLDNFISQQKINDKKMLNSIRNKIKNTVNKGFSKPPG